MSVAFKLFVCEVVVGGKTRPPFVKTYSHTMSHIVIDTVQPTLETHACALADALSGLSLDALPVDDWSVWLSADEVPNDDGGGDDDGVEEVSEDFEFAAKAVSAAADAWMTASKTVTADIHAAALTFLWARVSAVRTGGHWARAVLMVIARASAHFIAAPPTNATARGARARAALAAAGMYWKLLALPGAVAYGLFHAGALRRAMGAVKRFVDMAVASAPDESAGGRGKSAAAATATAVAPAPTGRRNPRRGGATAATEGGAADSNDEAAVADANDDNDDDDDESDDSASAPGKKRRNTAGGGTAKRRTATRRGAGAAVTAVDRILFNSAAVAAAINAVASVAALLHAAPLGAHPECLPLAADILLTFIDAPLHLAPRGDAGSFAAAAAMGVLALVAPENAPPLVASRLVLRRVKDRLLGAAPGAPSAASVAAGAAAGAAAAAAARAAAIAAGFAPDAADEADAAAAAGRIPPPLCPPDARAVRSRALLLTRVLITDEPNGALDAAVTACIGEADDALVQTLPAHVRARFPAIVALLQHLATGAAATRGDARGAVAEAVAALRVALPHSLRRAVMAFATSALGASARVPCRVMAVDIAAAALGLEGSERDGGLVRAMVLAEMAAPSKAESAREGSGYGGDAAAVAYAADAHVPAGTFADETDGDDDRDDGVDLNNDNDGVPTGITPPTAFAPLAGTGSDDPRPSVVCLLDLIVRRCSDRSPAVRARALGALASALDADACTHAALFCAIAGHVAAVTEGVPPTTGGGATGGAAAAAAAAAALIAAAAADAAITFLPPGAAASPLLALLIRRTGDAKPGVRRAAVAALGALGAHTGVSVALVNAPQGASRSVREALAAAAYRAARARAAAASVGVDAVNVSAALGSFALDNLVSRAADVSSLVRRAAAGSLARLAARAPTSRTLRDAWLRGVLPLARDGETSVASRAAEAVADALIIPLSRENVATPARGAWALLAALAREGELARCLVDALTFLQKEKDGLPLRALLAAVVRGVEGDDGSDPDAIVALTINDDDGAAVTPSSCARGAWLLLESLAIVTGGMPTATFAAAATLAAASWERGAAAAATGGATPAAAAAAARALRVLTSLSRAIDPTRASALATSAARALSTFSLPPPVAAAAVRAAGALAAAGAGDAPGAANAAVRGWATPALAAAATLLTAAVRGGEGAPRPAATAAALFTAGELSLIGLDGEGSQGVGDGGAGGTISPIALPSALATLVQALLAPTLRGDVTVRVPDAVRAHAVAALGKMGLRTPELARALLPVCVRDLCARDALTGAPIAPTSVRNNALFVLADVCVRYSALVEPHAGALASALSDPAPGVRATAAVLIAQLVATDFLKWRPVLFLRLARTLADVDTRARSLASAALGGPLAGRVRVSAIAYTVPLICALTGCAGRAEWAARAATRNHDDESAPVVADAADASTLILLSGVSRAIVYDAVLALLPEEAAFSVTTKLVTDVLGAVLDGGLEIARGVVGGGAQSRLDPLPLAEGVVGPPPPALPSGSSDALVGEVLSLLTSTRLRVGGKASTAAAGGAIDDDVDGEGDETAAAAAAAAPNTGGGGGVTASLAAAKAKLIGRLARKAVVENVLPVVIALKVTLTARASPLLGPLMTYLATLFSDYSEDVKGEFGCSTCSLLISAQRAHTRISYHPPPLFPSHSSIKKKQMYFQQIVQL